MKKTFVRIASKLFPDQAANFAYRQLTHPQVKKLRQHELDILDKAEKGSYLFKGFDIRTYTWHGGPEKILLIHGWEGQAGNFADLVEKLVEANFTVFAFDGPSHGFSSTGRTSLFEFTSLVGILIREFGVSKLVSHSFGGVATTYSLSTNLDLVIDRYVLLTTPDTFLERIEDVSEQIGITQKVKNKLINRLNKETSMDVKNMAVSKFVKTINVAKSLIIHDRKDTVIPIDRARNVYKNWTACELVEIEGTGHFRILRTEFVLARTLDFLKT
ncbi:MAG TPA: alpha/beta hydrolase [Chitinophagaceae bacterium]|jgi:pimeloyl-ACP methyl ester carboxylesterase|nr:alpha/beta hydrolase [Chitinophagaceae bacterium]